MTIGKTTKVADDLLLGINEEDIHMFKTDEELEKEALAIWGDQGNPLDFIIESAGSVRYSSSVCERCGKKFRFYRKSNLIYDKKAHKYHAWKQVCVDCINLETDAF